MRIPGEELFLEIAVHATRARHGQAFTPEQFRAVAWELRAKEIKAEQARAPLAGESGAVTIERGDDRRAERFKERQALAAWQDLLAELAASIDPLVDRSREVDLLSHTGLRIDQGEGEPFVIDLDGMTAPARVPLLLGHDELAYIGLLTSSSLVDEGVRQRGFLLGTETAGKVLELARLGVAWRCSIGASTTKTTILRAGKRATVNGQRFTGPLRIWRRSRINEVSLLATRDPADEATAARFFERGRLVARPGPSDAVLEAAAEIEELHGAKDTVAVLDRVLEVARVAQIRSSRISTLWPH